MNETNFVQIGDYAGFKQEFMQLNGFEYSGIDYTQPLKTEDFINLKP